jgi:hypothetical protein
MIRWDRQKIIIMLTLFNLCFLSLVVLANALSDLEKFALLKEVLLCEAKHVSDAVEHWSRMSFHDLHLQNSASLRGCLINPGFLNHPGNRGLQEPTRRLFELVVEYLGENALNFGDVIAFSGKVGYESRFKNMNIPFTYGREGCKMANPSQIEGQLPGGTMVTMKEYQPFFNYLKISAEEMAILLAGGHGLKEARADDTEFRGRFAHVDSGRDYIIKNFKLQWVATKINGIVEYFNRDINPESTKGHIRTPAEMVFYPSTVPRGQFSDPTASSIEAFMRFFSTQPESTFDREFAKVYGKMLAIGGGTKPYSPVPNVRKFECWEKAGKGGKGSKKPKKAD